MALASSSAVQVGYIQEVTFGTVPVAGNYKKLRITGESLDFALTKESSKEINATRSISSMVPVSAAVSGGIQGELTFAEYDPLLASTLQSTWTAFGTDGVSATSTVTFTATTLTASVATSGTSDWSTLQLGQWFRVAHGAASDANHGKMLRVSTTVAPTTTVITLDANTVAVASAAVANIAIQTSRLTHGTTQTSWSIERQATDVSQYFTYAGCTPGKVDINVASGSLTSVSFDFMGKAATRTAVTGLPGTPVNSTSYDVHSGVSNTAACQVWLGTTPLTGTFAQSISLMFDNALRSQEAICTLGAVGIGSGTINCTASVELYFADGAAFDAFLANDSVQLIFSSVDGDGNGYVFTLPTANISSYKINAGGNGQDLMASIELTGLRDDANAVTALQKVIFIDRVGDAVAA